MRCRRSSKSRNRIKMLCWEMGRVMKLNCILVISVGVLFSAALAASGGKREKKYTETVISKGGEKLSFEMVLIPGGKFLKGSPKAEQGRKDNEGPQHEVRLQPFYLCTTETTYELFIAYYEETVQEQRDDLTVEELDKSNEDLDAITGPTPIYGDPTMGMGGGTHPAIGATWHNAMTFCRWLSMKTGKKYRLPTEAEWEYAARAGAKAAYFFGESPDKLKEYAWFEANSDQMTQEVARKKPNPWGLYDMLGNVREWVYDFYSPTAYAEDAKRNPSVNPMGPRGGKVHVARGGDWDSLDEDLRCAAKTFEEDWWRFQDPQIPKSKWWLPQMDFIGFRIAMSVEPSR
ncbi:MAG TPA: SUMF1/EgtB/PvdO family nonheme iron enzyme [Planctomycetes bacterium]|nr:SUMF1/EgtB/PvdO family nonheme iron enzyme [Planctomycetota bacterium]